MDDGFVLTELVDELLDAVLVEIRFCARTASPRSSVRLISKPGLRNASSRSRPESRSNLNSVVIVKIVGSGKKVMSVPVIFSLGSSPMTVNACVVTPRSNAMWYTLALR